MIASKRYVAVWIICLSLFKSTHGAAECPEDYWEMYPCFCHVTTPETNTIDCSRAASESELEQAFKANLPQTNVTTFFIRGLTSLSSISSNLFANVTFEEIYIMLSNINYIDETAFENSHDTLNTWLVNDLGAGFSFPFESLTSYSLLESFIVENVDLSEMPKIKSTSMQSISFYMTEINTIPSDSFSELPNLFEIILTSNPLTTLEEGVFAGLESLISLRLTSNQFVGIEPRVFADLPNLAIVTLDQNQITVLEGDSFYNVPSMETLGLSRNGLSYLNQDMLSGIPTLKTLYLNSNPITGMDSGVFSNLTSPDEFLLDMSSNSLDRVTVDMFRGIIGNRIELESNGMTAIESGSFGDLVNSELFMENNNLTSLGEDWMRPLLERNNVVYTEGNPVECDCDEEWIASNPDLFSHYNEMDLPRCSNGTVITSLNPEGFAGCL